MIIDVVPFYSARTHGGLGTPGPYHSQEEFANAGQWGWGTRFINIFISLYLIHSTSNLITQADLSIR